MITYPKVLGIVVAAFVAGSFVASPELRAYAANTIRSTDIVDGEVKTADLASNAVTAAKVKDGEIKAAEIATDAVGAAELQGVTKLLFGQCKLTNSEASTSVPSGFLLHVNCTISGIDSDDTVLATLDNPTYSCFDIIMVSVGDIEIGVSLKNQCASPSNVGPATIALVVFDK